MEANRSAEYFYWDAVHPSDSGHQALADLLIGLVQDTLARMEVGSTRQASAPRAGSGPVGGGGVSGGGQLPPPLQAGVPANASTSVCRLQARAEPRRAGWELLLQQLRKLHVGWMWGSKGTASVPTKASHWSRSPSRARSSHLAASPTALSALQPRWGGS